MQLGCPSPRRARRAGQAEPDRDSHIGGAEGDSNPWPALPVRQRQVVVLRYFDDLSVEAAAEIMGSSPGTVKSHSAKGLAKLRAALADDEKWVEQS